MHVFCPCFEHQREESVELTSYTLYEIDLNHFYHY